MNILLFIVILLFGSTEVFAQSPDFGNTYNSKIGKKDMCIKIRSEDGTTVESKRCKELRITDGYFSEETDYFLIKAGIGVSGVSIATSDITAISNLHALVQKTISSDPAFQTGTLEGGVKGQTLTIEIVGNDGTGTFVLSPTTTIGFTSITFHGRGDYVTLLYLNDERGWLIFASGGITTVDSVPFADAWVCNQVTKTANYTLSVNDCFVICDASGGDVTLTLPTIASVCSGNRCKIFDIKKIDSTANKCIADGNGTEKIDDGLTAEILSQYESIKIQGNNSQWLIK